MRDRLFPVVLFIAGLIGAIFIGELVTHNAVFELPEAGLTGQVQDELLLIRLAIGDHADRQDIRSVEPFDSANARSLLVLKTFVERNSRNRNRFGDAYERIRRGRLRYRTVSGIEGTQWDGHEKGDKFIEITGGTVHAPYRGITFDGQLIR